MDKATDHRITGSPDHPILRVGLLGASIGIVLGLFEAACLRLTDFPLPLLKPHVPVPFWFFAPLLASVTFGLLGLLAGLLAALAKSRFVGNVVIAALIGLAGGYFSLVLRFYPLSLRWFTFLRVIITPTFGIALFFGCALVVLLATRRPNSALGALADIPVRPWSLVVLGSMIVMAVSVAIGHFPVPRAASPAPIAKSSLPNFVLIVWDTTRADHISSYGYSRNTTPHVDQLAQRGVLFENAISASSWTLPAMASMFTSLLPHQHGASADMPLRNSPRTLAEILRVVGYETVGINANYIYGVMPWGLARGFEAYTDSTTVLGYSLDASRLGHDFLEPGSEKLFHRSRYNMLTARQLNEEAYRWFDHRSGRPFFLFLNYMDAHDPYESPTPYSHWYGQIPEETKLMLSGSHYRGVELSASQREGLIAAYDGALAYMDYQVGELLRFLERSPEWSNTYVILTADHGEAFGEHHSYGHGWDLYREVLHVPLIIVGPGIPAGVRIPHTARTRQIFSTVLELAGGKAAVLRRTSLTRLWSPNYVPSNPEEGTLSELLDPTPPPAPPGMISLTTREWHLTYRRGYGRSRLYHWPTDPLEQQDVSELPENQATVEHLKTYILSILKRSYEPWRDPRYLLALSGLDLSPAPGASRGTEPPRGAGAPQTLFSANPESSRSDTKDFDEELLVSIPYVGP
jgi:arylsulfatase A-like enzyme